MQIRYVGIDHDDNARYFHFEVLIQGEPYEVHTVRADTRLLNRYGVGIGEVPALCAEKLDRDMARGIAHELTAADLRRAAGTRRIAEALRADVGPS